MRGRCRRIVVAATWVLVVSVAGCGGGDGVDFDSPEMPDEPPPMAPDAPEMDLEPPQG